jgi:ABC-type branched-subunit amino acid transport system ATPase component
MAELLALEGVHKSFGGLQAVVDLSFTVAEGSITGLIGPNGAGKSTVTNLVAGEMAPDRGRIRFAGRDIAGEPPHRVARLGVLRTFQLARELGRLTVRENLLMAPYPQAGENMLLALAGAASVRRQEQELMARAEGVLRLFRLWDLRNELAANLSGGQKKLLELARAMMTRPRLLLMDEPTAGVNPALVDEILRHVLGLRELGVTILVIEHNLGVIESLCDDVIVMASGRLLSRGSLDDLRRNPDVVEAYLGGGRAHGAV